MTVRWSAFPFRNFGHQNAIFAGLNMQGRWFIIMDSDFQHPPSLPPPMLKTQGRLHLVSAKLNKTENIGLFKKAFTSIIINWSISYPIPILEKMSPISRLQFKIKNSILNSMRGNCSFVAFSADRVQNLLYQFWRACKRHGDTNILSQNVRLGLKEQPLSVSVPCEFHQCLAPSCQS